MRTLPRHRACRTSPMLAVLLVLAIASVAWATPSAADWKWLRQFDEAESALRAGSIGRTAKASASLRLLKGKRFELTIDEVPALSGRWKRPRKDRFKLIPDQPSTRDLLDWLSQEVSEATGRSVAVKLRKREPPRLRVDWIENADQSTAKLEVVFKLKLRDGAEVHKGRYLIDARSDVGVPELIGSQPPGGVVPISRSSWIDLHFSAAVPESSLRYLTLECDDGRVAAGVEQIDGNRVILNPQGLLPKSSTCLVSFATRKRHRLVEFATAAEGAPATVTYDRRDLSTLDPFPDDYWLTPDAETRTGFRVALEAPARNDGVGRLFRSMIRRTRSLDGFSPLGGIVVRLSRAWDPTTLPRTPEASLEPTATLGLFDLTPESPSYGERVPFLLSEAVLTLAGQPTSHCLVIFPSIPLAPHGHYAMVVSNRVRARGDQQPFSPSPFFSALLGPTRPGEAVEITRARSTVTPVLEKLATDISPSIHPDDVALVLSMRIRSTDDIPDDLLAMRHQVRAMPPPSYEITEVTAAPGDLAAVVRGSWDAPTWLSGPQIVRDPDGVPEIQGSQPIDFALALPWTAHDSPSPLTVFLHGGGGSAEDVVSIAGNHTGDSGLAFIGSTGIFTRELGTDQAAQNVAVLGALLVNGRPMEFWLEDTGQHLAFLRLLEQLGTLDVLPLDGPDGVPDVDPALPITLMGNSAGAAASPMLLAYAPEVSAASLDAGSSRQTEQMVHQHQVGTTTFFRDALPSILDGVTPPDLWTGLYLYQMLLDPQDANNHAEFLYRNPIEVAGTTLRASILLQEGIRDYEMPNNATRALAWVLGPMPHIGPPWQPVPYLLPVVAPIQANLGASTTAGFAQFVPNGIPGMTPSPGCEFLTDGHLCAHFSTAAIRQRVEFLRSATTDPAPIIIDPLD